MENGRMNAAFENDLESSDLDSPGNSNIARPNENYDDLVRNKFIRPGPSKTNNWTTFAENIEIADSNTDILFSELKEQLEDEEFLNSELAKKNNSLEEEIQRLKDKLAKEQCLKNNYLAKLEQIQNDKDVIEVRLKDEQETLNEIANRLQEEQEINCQHQMRKNELFHRLEEEYKIEANLRDQIQQLHEENEENFKRLQCLDQENQRLREQLQSAEKLTSGTKLALKIAGAKMKILKSQYEETSLQLEETEDKCRRLEDKLTNNEYILETHKDENQRLQTEIDGLQNMKTVKSQYDETLLELELTKNKCRRLKDKLTQKENILKTQNQRLQMEIDDLQDKQQQRRCKFCCIC